MMTPQQQAVLQQQQAALQQQQLQFQQQAKAAAAAAGAGSAAPNVRYNEGVRNPQQVVLAPGGIPAGAAPQADDNERLTIKMLAAAPEDQKKRLIGEKLFPLIARTQPALAGKITGMLLEMDNGELIHLLESSDALEDKIKEAIQVLNSQDWNNEQ
jgi:polyadenylate-binding protein